LTNGFKTILVPDSSNPIVSLQLYIKTGSVNETRQTSGYAHFIEHLTFKATQNFPDNQISNQVPFWGGAINAYTEYDSTCYYLMLPSEHLEHGLAVLSDLAYRACFSAHDVEIEKDIIIEEIKQYANEPETGFLDWIQESYFLSSPLKNPVLGTAESVNSATLSKLKRFYNSRYRPDQAFLVVSGQYDVKQVSVKVKQYFSQWSAGTELVIPEYEQSPEQNGFRLCTKKYTKNGDYLALVIPELQENHRLSDANLIITKAFASGKQSRLYKRLVDNDKTALDVRLYSISGLLPGITVIQILPADSEIVTDIIYAFCDEWLKVGQSFFTKEEIVLLRQEMLYAWLYDFEYIEAHGGSLANEEMLGDYKELYRFPDKINAVTSSLLQECLHIYWNPAYLSIYYKGKNQPSALVTRNIRKLFKVIPVPGLIPIPDIQVNNQSEILIAPSIKNISKHRGDDFHSTWLENGMRLVMRRVVNKPTIGLAITSPVSQLCETSATHGTNYLTSNLLLYGTAAKDYDKIQKACLKGGFNLKVSHTLETTTLKGKCLSFNFEPMLDLASELLQNPVFPSKYLNIIKSNIYDSIRREKNSPFSHAYDLWSKQLLGRDTNINKPYANISSTAAISLVQIKIWYEKYYAPSGFTIAVVGDIDFHRTRDLCNKYFSKANKPSSVPEHAPYYQKSSHNLIVKKVESDQSNLILGGWCPPASDTESNTAFYLLSQVLGGDLSSRFFNILREQYGYAYQTGFDFASIREMGYWYAYAICDKTDYQKVYGLLSGIFSDINKYGINPDELTSAQNFLIGCHRIDMESLSWQASSLSLLYALDYDYEYFRNREQRIKNVSLEAIREIANRWFNPEDIYAYLEN
jgi:zinc protease